MFRSFRAAIVITFFTVVSCTRADDYRSVIVYTAGVAPDLFPENYRGPFGLVFVAHPKLRVTQQPYVPKELMKSGLERGMVRAALRVAKNGSVVEVRILEVVPKELAHPDRELFFKRTLFQREERNGTPIEFETDMMLLFVRGGKDRPNKSLEPTTTAVMPRASVFAPLRRDSDARVASAVAEHHP